MAECAGYFEETQPGDSKDTGDTAASLSQWRDGLDSIEGL